MNGEAKSRHKKMSSSELGVQLWNGTWNDTAQFAYYSTMPSMNCSINS